MEGDDIVSQSTAGIRRSAITTETGCAVGKPNAKIRAFETGNSYANQAFASARNRLPGALKNHQKIPFIQQLVDRDFALGA
jgi:hypothetical protein